jgi:hypothetical protein
MRTSRIAVTSGLNYYDNEIRLTYFVQKMLLSWMWMMTTDQMILILILTLLLMNRFSSIGP